jgi:ELWxxDGT repeat protein
VTHPDVGWELARSDGTGPNTELVKDINEGTDSSAPLRLTVVDGTLYFDAHGVNPDDGDTGRELWKSDGTGPGTELVEDIGPGTDDGEVEDLTALGSTLVFRADDGAAGSEWWKSDGTELGTTLLKDINPGPSGSDTGAIGMTVLDGDAYMAAFTAATGNELWKTDGTPEGTAIVKDINPDSASSSPFNLAVAADRLYLNATSPGIGNELWTSDGTEAGTVLVEDIRPGPGSSGPAFLVGFDSQLLFAADTGTSGHELWGLVQPPTATLGANEFAYGTHAMGSVSPPQTATITNNGGAPLNLTGFAFSGANPDDFFVSADTCHDDVAPGASCAVSVRMAPQAIGDRGATLTVMSDAPVPGTLSLIGAGGAGTFGPPGPPGADGAQGPPGEKGDRGKRGKRGKKAKVTCKIRGKRGRKVRCKVKYKKKKSSKGARAKWRLTRRGETVAHGITRDSTIDIGGALRLRPGRYRLTVTVAGARTVSVFRIR